MAEEHNGESGSGTGDLDESPVGRSYVGRGGIIGITSYLVLLTLFLFYIEFKIWPTVPLGQSTASMPGATSGSVEKQAGTSTTQPPALASSGSQGQPSGAPASTAGEAKPATAPPAPPVHFFWREQPYVIGDEIRLFLIVVVSGALGSLLHTLRSVSWYIGNRKLKWSWAATYILQPFTGAVLSTIFYVALRGGFLPQSTLPNVSPYAFAGLGCLVGLFNQEAVLKLKQVAETVFTKSEPGKDHVGSTAIQITSVSPLSGPATGGTQLTITGVNFLAGAKVAIGGTPASVVRATSTSIVATTPAHAAGPESVDVEVSNPDGQKAVKPLAYRYL